MLTLISYERTVKLGIEVDHRNSPIEESSEIEDEQNGNDAQVNSSQQGLVAQQRGLNRGRDVYVVR